MVLKLEIDYEQLLYLFKQLPAKQKKQFLLDISKETNVEKNKDEDVREPGADYLRTDMKLAAKILLNDYQNDQELLAFTSLDSETFHETR